MAMSLSHVTRTRGCPPVLHARSVTLTAALIIAVGVCGEGRVICRTVLLPSVVTVDRSPAWTKLPHLGLTASCRNDA